MRILFHNAAFPAARTLLAELLPEDEVAVLDPSDPSTADVLVPMTGVVDAELIDAVRPRLIHQFGAGIDGVDLAAATEREIRWPTCQPGTPATPPRSPSSRCCTCWH
ncbi:MAG: hypothetical protein ACRDQ5_19200 [Sciscionella sp.]